MARHGGESTEAAVAPRVRPNVLIAVLAAAGISVSLMQTLIIPLIPELPTLLRTGPANASWAITATLLTAAVATPLFGRLGDIYGPKPVLITCAALLTAGSVIAAVSTSLIPVIVGRGLQGFGMPIIPLGISVLRAAVPADRVGSAMGIMSASLGVGGALGLPLSAVIAENFNWHVLFWFAAGLGAAALICFAVLVPPVGSRSSERVDLLGAVGLAGGLTTLLLAISKGQTWGWTSATTLSLFAASPVIFAVFGWWQLRASSPIVDLRTTVRRPVLTTNLASVGVGFGLFALSLVAPQVLELPAQTGYGLGQSMLHAGLWMAPGGLAMMVSAPIAARIAAATGPRFTLVVGCAIISVSYVVGLWLLDSPVEVLVLNVLVSVGVGFAFASLPALINAAVPVSETAAANGINALARSLGTSVSSAVMGAVLAGMTTSFAGRAIPSLAGFHTALIIAACAAGVAGLIALAIPKPTAVRAGVPAAQEIPVGDLEAALTRLDRHSALGGYADAAPTHFLTRRTYVLLAHLDATGPASIAEMAASLGADAATVSSEAFVMLRDGLVEPVADDSAPAWSGRTPRFTLTGTGRERLWRQRSHKVDGLRRAVDGWDAAEVQALVGYVTRLTDGIDDARRGAPTVTGRNAP
ncbi:MFS transporter [Mycolicibacterium litorale]|uniref:MFS transporter n=1 Tax=Mycolicibacterium litorale TaxID=758802 RepID=UPI001066B172|nr:MFS transporter [Mycolicibacterium litorale]MCV7414060.1 MFS transporter [Mycolicibacterium litorale]